MKFNHIEHMLLLVASCIVQLACGRHTRIKNGQMSENNKLFLFSSSNAICRIESKKRFILNLFTDCSSVAFSTKIVNVFGRGYWEMYKTCWFFWNKCLKPFIPLYSFATFRRDYRLDVFQEKPSYRVAHNILPKFS